MNNLNSQDSPCNMQLFPSPFLSCWEGVEDRNSAFSESAKVFFGGIWCCHVSSTALMLWGGVSSAPPMQADHTNHPVYYVERPWYPTFPWYQSRLCGMPDWKGQALLVRLEGFKIGCKLVLHLGKRQERFLKLDCFIWQRLLVFVS